MTVRPLIVAHRGASKAARENTLEAFRLARELGASMVELDVRRTRDGALVVHHDARIAERPLIDHEAADLPSYIPTLAGALDACHGMDVNVEIKSDPSEPDYDASQRVAMEVVDLLLICDHSMLLQSTGYRETLGTRFQCSTTTTMCKRHLLCRCRSAQSVAVPKPARTNRAA